MDIIKDAQEWLKSLHNKLIADWLVGYLLIATFSYIRIAKAIIATITNLYNL